MLLPEKRRRKAAEGVCAMPSSPSAVEPVVEEPEARDDLGGSENLLLGDFSAIFL
jgi:hypothetical protein